MTKMLAQFFPLLLMIFDAVAMKIAMFSTYRFVETNLNFSMFLSCLSTT